MTAEHETIMMTALIALGLVGWLALGVVAALPWSRGWLKWPPPVPRQQRVDGIVAVLTLGMWLGLTVAGAGVAYVLGAGPLPKPSESMPAAYLFASLVSQLVICVLLALLIIHLLDWKPKHWGMDGRSFWVGVIGCVPAYLMCMPLVAGVDRLTQLVIAAVSPDWTAPLHPTVRALLAPDAPVQMRLLLVLMAVVAAPLWEELYFRGVLNLAVATHSRDRLVAVIVGGIIFGLVHWPATPQYVPALAALGIWLGVLYYWSGSLWLPILVHALFNGVTVTTRLLVPLPGVPS